MQRNLLAPTMQCLRPCLRNDTDIGLVQRKYAYDPQFLFGIRNKDFHLGFFGAGSYRIWNERVELTLKLAASFVSAIRLQSMVNCNNANANFVYAHVY